MSVDQSQLHQLREDLHWAAGDGITQVATDWVRTVAEAVQRSAESLQLGSMSATVAVQFPTPTTAEVSTVEPHGKTRIRRALSRTLGQLEVASAAPAQASVTPLVVESPAAAAASLILRGRA